MKTVFKIFAVAAAFGMAPAALAQQAAAPAAAQGAQAAPAGAQAAPAGGQAPRDAISAASQAAPAQPEEVSGAETATDNPSNASVLSSSLARTAPDATVGQPTQNWGFQPQVTPIGQEALWFHNVILMPLITIISVFVLLLLLWVIVRYRRSRNPTPSRTSHHTGLEIAWTLIPVLILVAIAVPSIRLLAHQYSPPKADLTIKATGNQWYWSYTYPDHGDFELVSNMLKDEDAKTRGEPRLLAVDERVVVPVGATVKMIVTSADVIHAWGIPAFWAKIDAVPGRLNETWFKADRPGVYYGQCFELCGARHAYMPIAVEVVQPAQFAAWVASKGGTMPGGAQATSGDETATSPITNPGAAAPAGPVPTAGGSATETSPAPPGITPGTATPAVSTQGATESKRGSN